MSEPVFTGWSYTDSIRFSPCSRCSAAPGEPCRTPNGRKARTPHVERGIAFHTEFGTLTCRAGYTMLFKGKTRAEAHAILAGLADGRIPHPKPIDTSYAGVLATMKERGMIK